MTAMTVDRASFGRAIRAIQFLLTIMFLVSLVGVLEDECDPIGPPVPALQ